jgi:type I restriction enzyme S subunit
MDLIASLTQQTELRVIPADWNIKQIGDLKPFVTSGSRGWAEFYTEYGSLFVRITNLSRSSIYLGLDDVRLVTVPRDNAEAVRTELQDGDMLISITADIGM